MTAAPLIGIAAAVGWLLRSGLLLLPPDTARTLGFTPGTLAALAIVLTLLLIPAVWAVYARWRDQLAGLWTIAAAAAIGGLVITALGDLLALTGGADWSGFGTAAAAFGVIVTGAAQQAQAFAWWQRKREPPWIGHALAGLGLLVIPLIVVPAIAGLVYGAVWIALLVKVSDEREVESAK